MSNVVRIDQPNPNQHFPAGTSVTVRVFAKSSGKLQVDLADGSFVGFSPGDNAAPLQGTTTADVYTCDVLIPSGQFHLCAKVKFTDGGMVMEDASDEKSPYYGDV